MDETPEFTNWRDAWDWHAEQTRHALQQESDDVLLKRIAAGHYDSYFAIWYVLRDKTTLARAAPVLLAVLRRETGEDNMLTRYHCAAALFHLLGYADEPIPELRARAQWDHHGEAARQKAIDELEALIRQRLLSSST